MKITNIALGLATAAAIFITGCSIAQKTYSEESLGLRKVDIYSENTVLPSKTDYTKPAAGTSTKIERAFQDAPPMIPHDVEGMLPITIDNNQCVMCHEPAVATSMGATPIPKSHFIDFRPKHHYDGKVFTKAIDNMKNEVSVKPISHLAGARFNCSQCHTPQSNGDLAVESEFKAAYTKKDGQFKSSWDEVILDDLDTIKEK
jgi:cytochrome c-type protein NapB